jgi:hypothetical protein
LFYFSYSFFTCSTFLIVLFLAQVLNGIIYLDRTIAVVREADSYPLHQVQVRTMVLFLCFANRILNLYLFAPSQRLRSMYGMSLQIILQKKTFANFKDWLLPTNWRTNTANGMYGAYTLHSADVCGIHDGSLADS